MISHGPPIIDHHYYIDSEEKFIKEIASKDDIVLAAFIESVCNLGVIRNVANQLRKGKFCQFNRFFWCCLPAKGLELKQG